jgi:hypothetical protein
MTVHPKVSVFVEPPDRTVNVIEGRFDIAIRAKPVIEDVAGLVAKTLGNSQRVLAVSPAFLERYGRPESPADLPRFSTAASVDDMFDSGARWNLINPDPSNAKYRAETQTYNKRPACKTSGCNTRRRYRIAAGTSGVRTLKRGTRSTSLAGMVRREEYPPSGLSHVGECCRPSEV